MRVLWHSNAPWVGSGYGGQTGEFLPLIQADGHEVIASAMFGLRGHKLRFDDYEVMPGSYGAQGEDVLPAHIERFEPDVTVVLYDVWPFPKEVLTDVTIWCPVDREPIPPAVLDHARACQNVWAMSRFGLDEFRRNGVSAWYVPHGVNTEVFKPGDRDEARRLVNVDPSAFMAVTVASNVDFPSRKCLDRLIKAWAKFAADHRGENMVLWLHAKPIPTQSGLHLEDLIRFYCERYDVPETIFRTIDLYLFAMGEYSPAYLAALYNAADVMVLPSRGGGFEIPLIEAQACGCPVITTGFTAMRELVGVGFTIEPDDLDGKMWSLAGAEWALPMPSQIVEGLNWAFARVHDPAIRRKARVFALEYDSKVVYQKYMKPALEFAAATGANARKTERSKRTSARVAMRRVNVAYEAKPGGVNGAKPDTNKAPVALVIYNRPEKTARALAEIAKYQPGQLFIIADGAKYKPDEARVMAAREAATQVDWPCVVRTDYAVRNMGPGERARTGFDWVFSQVDRCIILEDDLIPAGGFFAFHESMLRRYATDERVVMVSGFNYAGDLRSNLTAGYALIEPVDETTQIALTPSYFFSKFGATWGWSTWARAWANYDHEMTMWPGAIDKLRKALPEDREFQYVKYCAENALRWGSQTWDYRWLVARTLAGLTIVPTRNLVRNAGYDAEATHAKHKTMSRFATLEAWPMVQELVHPVSVVRDREADRVLFAALRADEFERVTPPPSPLSDNEGEQTAARCPDCDMGDWSPIGLLVNGALCVPCRRTDCERAKCVDRQGGETFRDGVFPGVTNGVRLDIEDDPRGGVSKIILKEIATYYRLDEIAFKPGDVVLDIGAHVGVVSCYLGKKYPFIKIFAFEPVPENFERLKRNLNANGVTNVFAIQKAVTGDGLPVAIRGDLAVNSGGSSMYGNAPVVAEVESMTLADIFATFKIEQIRLLKLDAEGAEFGILETAGVLLYQVDAMRGEFHHNLDRGHDAAALLRLVRSYGIDAQVTLHGLAQTVES